MGNFVGQSAPDFTSIAVLPGNEFEYSFNLRKYLNGRFGLLMFYPMNFGFVEPTEILALQARMQEFTQRQTAIIAISCDSHLSHMEWRAKPPQEGGVGNLAFPLVSDITRRIAQGYEVLVNDSMSLRNTFLLDRDFIVRWEATYDLPVGRSVDEILRVIDAIQLHQKNGRVTPEGWASGQSGIKPTREDAVDFIRNKYFMKKAS